VLLAGPAWCSHFCYIGAWDNFLAARRTTARVPGVDGRARRKIDPRWYTLAATAGTALILRLAGVPMLHATLLGAAFGLAGIGIMVFASPRSGTMEHCTNFCPLGLIALKAGRLSPFRMEVRSSCRDCGLCLPTCRYGALTAEDLRRGRPGANCTLCGDCLASCRRHEIAYRFAGLSPAAARKLFVVLVDVLHAVCLGVARI
jgi:NAD-dependent dihydropyrimidine dehydrogenase PreA subunit